GTEGILLDGFDTSAHDDGEYTMRLVVRNDLGQEALVRHAVEIRNVRLAHPENNDILRAGEHVEIRGTVAGEGRTFEFAWGVGPNPAQWHDTGFELRGGGRSPVIESALATWDSSVAPAGEFVTIRVRALREGRSVGE